MAAQRRQIKARNRGLPNKALSAEAHKRRAKEHERLAAALRRTASKPVARMRGTLTACGSVRLFRGEGATGDRHAETLIDTKLRKSFRRKNTVRKSFLGHAQALNDLPIEAATGRPTRDLLPTPKGFVGPRPAATGDSQTMRRTGSGRKGVAMLLSKRFRKTSVSRR